MSNFGFIELIFVFGIVLGLALWELARVRRDLRRTRERTHDKQSNDT